jgi:hypothetical protein
VGQHFGKDYLESDPAKLIAVAVFLVLAVTLYRIGTAPAPDLDAQARGEG